MIRSVVATRGLRRLACAWPGQRLLDHDRRNLRVHVVHFIRGIAELIHQNLTNDDNTRIDTTPRVTDLCSHSRHRYCSEAAMAVRWRWTLGAFTVSRNLKAYTVANLMSTAELDFSALAKAPRGNAVMGI